MMKVHVRIDKFNRDHYFEFDNVIPRDEVVHKLLSESKEYKTMYDKGTLQDNDMYITWTDPDSTDTVEMSTEEAVLATEAAPEIAAPESVKDAAGTTEPASDDAVLAEKPVAEAYAEAKAEDPQ